MPGFPSELQRLFLNVAVNQAAMALQAYSLLCHERATRQRMERLFELGKVISAELDRKKLLQAITDAATELSGAQFGSFLYNVADRRGESYMLYTLSGVSRELFSGFPMPRNTCHLWAHVPRRGRGSVGQCQARSALRQESTL